MLIYVLLCYIMLKNVVLPRPTEILEDGAQFMPYYAGLCNIMYINQKTRRRMYKKNGFYAALCYIMTPLSLVLMPGNC